MLKLPPGQVAVSLPRRVSDPPSRQPSWKLLVFYDAQQLPLRYTSSEVNPFLVLEQMCWLIKDAVLLASAADFSSWCAATGREVENDQDRVAAQADYHRCQEWYATIRCSLAGAFEAFGHAIHSRHLLLRTERGQLAPYLGAPTERVCAALDSPPWRERAVAVISACDTLEQAATALLEWMYIALEEWLTAHLTDPSPVLLCTLYEHSQYEHIDWDGVALRLGWQKPEVE